MKIVTITLMRKGSKRFPNKMMASLRGKPLYQWTVEAALDLGYEYHLFHDYDELPQPKSELYHEHTRTPYFSGDTHRTNEEILASGIDADIYILLQATSPFRDVGHITKCLYEFNNYNSCGGAFYVKRQKGFHYFWRGAPVNFVGRTDNGATGSDIVKETGGLYIFKKRQLERPHITSHAWLMWEDPYGIDIDTEADLAKAQAMIDRGEV